VFSYIGFETKEVAIGNQTAITVVLEEDTEFLDEVVVIGYAAISREKVLGAVGSVKASEIIQSTPVSTFDAVQGRLSGVQILTNGGPGAGFDIKIRGTSTFSQGGTEPLYVVDGQQLDNIDNIDPNDIASLEVLKDGATAAIYGSKAANGVVLITTKTGRSGDFKIDVTTSTTFTNLIGGLPLANSNERRFYEKIRGNNPLALTGNERDSLSLLQRNSFDLEDLITRTAVRNQFNVALSGGGEKSSFYWNTGFLNEEGVVVNTSYKRINSLLKLDLTPSKNFKAGTKLNLTFEDQFGLDEGQVFAQMVERIPYFPVFEPDGSYTPEIAGRQNPVAEVNARKLRSRNYRAQLFNYAQYSFLPTLSFKSTLGINFRFNKDNDFEPIITQNPNSMIPRGAQDTRMTYDIQQENFINYKEEFGKHSLSAFGGMQIQKYWLEDFDVSAKFGSDAIETFNNIDPLTFSLDSGENRRSNLFSLFGGVNYDFDDTYLFGATLRRDGSSRFGTNNKYGYFPSATIGWRLSKEGFMQNVNFIDNLLLRASYGETGNQSIGDYEFIGAYLPNAQYNGVNGVAPTRLGNPDLSWESTASTNIGMDLNMLNRRLNFSVDFWRKETTDLLATVPLPEESGYSGVRENVGAVRNEGIDLSVSGTVIRTDNFSWNSSFNITLLRNEVLKLKGGTSFLSGDYLIEEGAAIGNIFGYKNLGVYQYDESNAYTDGGDRLTPNFDENGTFTSYSLNGQAYTGNVSQLTNEGVILKGGDFIWDDLNGDLDITTEDRQVIGNGVAKTFGGFSNDFRYKNFSMSFLFDYSFGNDIHRRYDEVRNGLFSSNATPSPDYINNSWREQGDISVYPILKQLSQQRERPNSLYVVPGDYIKLRFVRFNYDMPKIFTDRVDWVKAISFNLSFNNLATWTNYTGYNPELGSRGNPLEPGVDILRYPNKRDIIFGMRVQF
uniref:SusC/RagA family TonB-linked outer membrane protein n=1 Tax=Mariniflexile sp. TaxID=1979402 RepID=UPI004047A9F0